MGEKSKHAEIAENNRYRAEAKREVNDPKPEEIAELEAYQRANPELLEVIRVVDMTSKMSEIAENDQFRATMKRELENPTPAELAASSAAAAELDELMPPERAVQEKISGSAVLSKAPRA